MLNHMVKYSQQHLDETFRALADGTRRAILARLSRGDALVSELAAPFSMSLPAISKHLRVLEDAGLISKKKSGRNRVCHLEAEPLHKVASWTDFYKSFWDIRLDRLSQSLEQNPDDVTSGSKEHGK